MPSQPDPYAILGVTRDATEEEISRAHRRLAMAVHPDLNADPAGGRRMREINGAWRTLSRPDLRAAWDAAHPTPRVADSGWAPIATVPTPRSVAAAPPGRAGWVVLVVVMVLMVGMLIGGVLGAASRPPLPGGDSPGYHGNLP